MFMYSISVGLESIGRIGESVTQSQHITVELSAAIKLLEQTLSQ